MTKAEGGAQFIVANGNLYHLFEEGFAQQGARVAIRPADGQSTMTYAEMSAAVSRYANALGVLGVEPGDRVTVQIEKSVSGVLLYLAVMKAGAIYQPLNTAYTEAEVDYFVGDAEPKLIVCDPARQQRLRAIADAHKVFAVVNLDGKGEGSLAA
ncbi:MAG: malonyl-CoA synthase, partial [Hyphomicrobiales bacterium]